MPRWPRPGPHRITRASVRASKPPSERRLWRVSQSFPKAQSLRPNAWLRRRLLFGRRRAFPPPPQRAEGDKRLVVDSNLHAHAIVLGRREERGSLEPDPFGLVRELR